MAGFQTALSAVCGFSRDLRRTIQNAGPRFMVQLFKGVSA